MSSPLGDLHGFRWCSVSNKYFATTGMASESFASKSNEAASTKDVALEQVCATPVSLKIIETLPNSHGKKRSRAFSQECSICLRSGASQYGGPRMKFVQLPCKHSFHLYCIEGWLLNRSGSCPNCHGAVDVALSTAARHS